MSNSNTLAGHTLIVLTMKFTTRTAFNELDKLLGVFLILRTIKDQFKLPNVPFLYQLPVDFENFILKCR